jgi:hypothetical protein
MNVQVIACFKGNNKTVFNLRFKVNGKNYHETIVGEYWERATAIRAKDVICGTYGVKRQNIRFV